MKKQAYDLKSEDGIIAAALSILASRIQVAGTVLNSPDTARKYLTLQLATEQREVFGVLFLNAQNGVIAFDRMFSGTLTQTAVYPREVVKAALVHNAAAVMLVHNHPSGTATPSQADKVLTSALRTALDLIDVRVLDHFIVGGTTVYSFAEHGLL